MYLRQSNKWKEFLLAEAIEDIGLPPTIAHYLRQQNEAFGPIENKHLTWLGQLVKRARTDLLLPRADLEEIKRHLRRAVITTLEKRDGLNPEAFGELYAEAVAPLIEYRQGVQETSPNIAHIKKFKKKFMKNLRRLEIIPPFIKGFDSYVDNRMRKGVEEAFMKSVKPIMLLLAEDPASYDVLRGEIDLRGSGVVAKDILDNPPKAEDQVIHEFDNGYFWYDIRSHACDFEAKKMGHCGRAEQGTLYSLRAGEKRNVKPMVTIEFDGSIVYQIKGKANLEPKEDLWTYIDWFIENMEVERITEELSEELSDYLKEKHPDLEWGDAWVKEATELINNHETYIEQDSQTTLEIDWPGGPDDVQDVGLVLRHQAFWPVKDVVAEEDTHRLIWEIKQDAESIADDTLYPNPRVEAANIFRKGEQDSRTAMLRIELTWSDRFEPHEEHREEAIKEELERLGNYLSELDSIAGWLTSTDAAPDEDNFDYNGFHEGIQKRLEEYGVYRDLAGEIDAEEMRDRERETGQMELPLQEQRIIQRWNKIIK